MRHARDRLSSRVVVGSPDSRASRRQTVPAKEDVLADADDGPRQAATRGSPSSPSRHHRIQLQPLQT